MARKTKQGIDYFPHSCNYDDELKYIIALHGSEGYMVYFELLRKIYSDFGYYMNADKKVIALFSNEINVSIEKINVIINDCLGEHLFNKSIHKKYNILTSKGIQERYFEAIKRRKEIDLVKEYILIINVDNLLINVDINYLNVDKSTQSKVKESKEEKSKLDLAFFEFEKMRNKIKKPLTDNAKKLILDKLNELSKDEETQIQILEQSIMNSWQGVFPLRNSDIKNKSGKKPLSI